MKEGGSVDNCLKDQLKALEWVRKHIHKVSPFRTSFRGPFLKVGGGRGGPNHVVLGGASAGASSITLLLSAHGGRDDKLFHAAAAEFQSF